MRRVLAFAVPLLGLVSYISAAAASSDIAVIPGVGPQNPSPRAAYAAPPPRQAGAYGGGFIEFLMTGGTSPPSTSRPVYVPRPSSQAPEAAPMRQLAALAPPRQQDGQPTVESEPSSEYRRQEVEFPGTQRPGTIVIDTPRKFLFLVLSNGRALRYGIGVGRPGFEWSGVKTISRKAEWPDWTPPPEMMLRRPDLPGHMAGGPENPLGARALYLGSSMYRIHGTNEPSTIGQNLSSGCIRMMNEDVIDLYGRVAVGTKVIVI
jgi:lipoprotein-anchoring transpeptidase ErfK/SrfK